MNSFGAVFREREGSIFSNHQHFAVSTGICRVACPLPALRVDKPLIEYNTTLEEDTVQVARLRKTDVIVIDELSMLDWYLFRTAEGIGQYPDWTGP